MARIRKPVLKLLENLYGFIDGQSGAPTEVELGLGITPVHDLSRMAEFGASEGPRAGLWLMSAQNIHVGVGGIATDVDFVTAGFWKESFKFDANQQWVWILGAYLMANDNTDFASAQILMRPGTIANVGIASGPAPAVANRLIARFTSVPTDGSQSVGLATNASPDPLPMLVFDPTADIRFESISDTLGTVTVTHNLVIWVGPIGVMPPGYR